MTSPETRKANFKKGPVLTGSFLHPTLETPTDETGLPYCIWPSGDLPEVGNVVDPIHPVADFHHNAHPRASLDLNDKADLAVMNARVEWVLFDDHHINKNGYHAHYQGPELPETHKEKLRWVIMASAGHISEVALDCSGDQPVEREMPPHVKEDVWNKGIVRVACPAAVRSFLLESIIDDGFEGLAEGAVMKFLRAKERPRKLELGHFLLSQIVEEKISDVQEVYKDAYKSGTMPNFVPKSPQRFIRKRLTESTGITNRLINKMERSGSRYVHQVT